MAYAKKTSYFEIAPPGPTIAYKKVNNLYTTKEETDFMEPQLL